MLVESRYVCAFCGEDIDTVVDTESGTEQEYVEDCPVCCRPHRLRVEVRGRRVTIRAEAE